jgi:hypothetical protein
MKTEEKIRNIESSKEFKNLISKANKYFKVKEKLQKEELRRLNKNLPLLDITKDIYDAKYNMNYYYDKTLNMLKL